MAKKKKSSARKMKAYDSFDLWMRDQEPSFQTLIKYFRKFIRTHFKKLDETVKWGNGVWTYKDLPVIYIYAGGDILQFGLFAGAFVKDPQGLLEGNGKYIRAVRVQDKKEIDPKYLSQLISQAIKINYKK